MKRCRIIRYATGPHGTRSHIIGSDQHSRELIKLHGLECPWLSNVPYKSCIPDGIWTLVPWESSRFGKVYTFVGAGISPWKRDGPDGRDWAARWGCHQHIANYARQLQGCMALGKSSSAKGDKETGGPSVWSSRAAQEEWHSIMGYPNPIYAEIVWRLTE
tara:strand:- start:799 stop:1278 length:480 start_codon:yes stop_codon:yes gene_type:complete